jgi:hypothetical protein
MEFNQFVQHFPTGLSQELLDYARDVVFLSSRYIFTRREGKHQYGYCTHCGHEHETDGLRHGDEAICLACGSRCTVKASGRSRKYMCDEAYFVYYEKSAINPRAIIARGFYAVRDYHKDYRGVETQIEPKALYLFSEGQSVMWERPWVWYSLDNGMYARYDWGEHKTIGSLAAGVMAHKPVFCSYESIEAAVANTPFQYSAWERYQRSGGIDFVKFFDLASKYPCIEYLTKLGMRGLVLAKLHGDRTYNVINWRAKNPLKVLKMSKHEFKELRASGAYIEPWLLYIRELAKRDGSRLTITELSRISNEIPESYHTYLKVALRHTTLEKLDTYLTKQLNHTEVRIHYDSKRSILTSWIDYVKDCIKLGLDITDDAVKFPRNVYQAHQNTIKQIKIKADEELNRKIKARKRTLEKMSFEALGLLIRAAKDSNELIAEGKALHHCVGTYADRYARGETDIFVIRRAQEPDKPFYTMEVHNGNVVQCRGLKNCVPTDEVKAFVELFVSRKLLTKKRTRVGIAV